MTSPGYLTITHPSVGTLNIRYFDGGVKHQFDKLLQVIAVPKTLDAQNLPLVWLVDLQRIQETITVTGILEDETTETMWAKKTKLRSIINAKGTMAISWNTSDTQQPYTVNITKASIEEKTVSYEDSTEQLSLNVTIVFTIGQNKG